MLARLFALTLGLLAAGAFSIFPAHAGRLVDMEIVNRSTGETLDLHRFRGQQYVAGNPGDRYGVRLVNRTGQRVLVVLSVDGVNVVTGETAAPDQSGYVLGPWGRVEVAGWRKSLQEVAQFYFTALPDSYAARTDRPDNVGVIGAAVFREKGVAPPPMPYLSEAAPAARAQSGAAEAAADAAGPQAMRKAERLGTGHGEREYAPTRYTDFERASLSPAEVLSVRYDSKPNLMARGVIPKPRPLRPYWPEPQPFPGQFVPDPQG
jgi:hypothetical protein